MIDDVDRNKQFKSTVKYNGLTYLEDILKIITNMSDEEFIEYIDVVINKNDNWRIKNEI
jgi:hypothetical protein